MRIIGLILTILILYIHPVFALSMDLNHEVICKNIIKSFQEEPDNWILKSQYLVYVSNLTQIQKLRKQIYPEVSAFAEVVIIYNIYDNFVRIDKPFDLDFDSKIEKKLLFEIKKFIYKDLKNQVGSLIDKEKNIKTKEIPVETKEEIDGMKKL